MDRPASFASVAVALLRRVAALPLEWVAPAACAACDDDVPAGRVFCGACAATVTRLPLVGCGPAGSLAPFAFGGAVAEAVRRFKYGGRPDLARSLGHLLRAAVRDARLDADLVMQVPLHPRRRAERGYDQAGMLARHVAAELGRPHRPELLRRLRHGPAQASLGREERRSNPALVFAGDGRLAGARVLLVDDVITTGATARACCDALTAAGAASVLVVTLARAEASA